MNKENEILIDGENAVVGRLASFAAKQALLGNKVIIVNSEKAIVVGTKEDIVAKYLRKMSLGGGNIKGPFFDTRAERILKRTIRGMLDYTHGRGREAFKRIICYSGIPKEYQNVKIIKSARGKKGLSLLEISSMLKGRK